MPLIDFQREFRESAVSCAKCGWTGLGAEMKSGEAFGDGVEKDCPACGENWGFVQWSVVVADHPRKKWRKQIGRVEF